MSAGLWVVVIAVGGALAFGLWRAMTDGRLRGTKEIEERRRRVTRSRSTQGSGFVTPLSGNRGDSSTSEARPWADQLGERGTLVQFSSAFCAPCRTTRQVLSAVADAVPGVNHIEIDAEHHLDLVRELGIFRTPTTLILDAEGNERLRASGVPKRDQVIAAL